MKHQAEHSTPVCHLLWPGNSLPSYKAASAKSCFLITAQFLPKLALPLAAFQAGRNACLLTIKASQVGVFHCPIPSPEETAALSHPTKLHQLAAKKTTQETHKRCGLVTREPATPEDSWCPEKFVSFISSADQAEQCLSQRGITTNGC